MGTYRAAIAAKKLKKIFVFLFKWKLSLILRFDPDTCEKEVNVKLRTQRTMVNGYINKVFDI